MVSRRDLLEAHQFDRRRLVEAFMSGGRCRGVEPPRSGRALLAGAALALLVVAGGAIADVGLDQTPSTSDTPEP